MSPELLKLLIGLAVCVVVAIIAIAVMASSSGSSKSSSSSESSESSGSSGSSESSGSSSSTESTPAYEDLPSPSESGEVPSDDEDAAEDATPTPTPTPTATKEVPSPSDSTIAFDEEKVSAPKVTVVPKTYYLRLKDAYGKQGNENVEVYYFNPATKKKTKLQTLRMGKSISKKKTYDILLSTNSAPLITNVSLYLTKGSKDAILPYIYIVEKEGSTDTNTSENFVSILYNDKKKYVNSGLYWSKETYYFKPKK